MSLYLGDCLDLIADLPDCSVGHILTDPPYGQTNESYDAGVDPALWRECYRVTGPDAALVSFAGNPTYHRLASDIERAGWKVRQMWGWIYKDGLITSAYPREGFDRLAPAFTPICFATKGKVLLRLRREGNPWDLRSSRSNSATFSDRQRPNNRASASGHWPKSIAASDDLAEFQYFALNNQFNDRASGGGHPNVKPISLMRWLASKLPNVGRPILDPFAGSGTTLVAADLEGHDSIGFERDPGYFAIAERRIADALQPNEQLGQTSNVRLKSKSRQVDPPTCDLFASLD